MINFSPTASNRRLPQTLLRPNLSLVSAPPGKGMLVAIDANVEHRDALATGMINGAKLLLLDAQEDAIAQITAAIRRSKMQSLHIVTHGSPGCLHFSSGDLTLSNLPQYAEQIESWFCDYAIRRSAKERVKDPNGFLSLYACNLAKGEKGKAFIEHLHHLIGVSIHAANSRVSSQAAGGSWLLNVSHPFPRQAAFPFAEDLLDSYEVIA